MVLLTGSATIWLENPPGAQELPPAHVAFRRQYRFPPRWLMSVQPAARDPFLWTHYAPHAQAWDELFQRNHLPHDHCQALVHWLGQLAVTEFQDRRHNADLVFINQGITFSVYADRRG